MDTSRQDQALVQECLHGNEAAWSALVDKYKNLIFSIPIKRGLTAEIAADIFQSVCLALVSELPRLREARALPAWLIQTTLRKCLRTKEEGSRYLEAEFDDEKPSDRSPKMPDQLLSELEREQIVREAVLELSSECKRLVEALFYQTPPASYDVLATTLDIPKGSIGPTRMRCLERLRRRLEEKGF